ncbi:unnamed protein product [Didymodactylos carnosus]|uniref:TRPM SLOG domain-containing protein n=1 Tax=Didymodactylos carnosus TaxID=1234261 RepID=A0A815R0W0_9BILA|nr:unnamed protein product [Didymodactylos carnosus]CAF1469509.1 unnamed protein product [Didymodactylos carnosus]CAF4122454.1 unnamed protein product [Didymodactylos carnosus]CAF4337693.1 unnamed protein product [Didymodactylos carnosus]
MGDAPLRIFERTNHSVIYIRIPFLPPSPANENSNYQQRPALWTGKDVVDFMRKAWDLDPPELIISVTGGARDFKMPTRLRNAFQRGLIAAAETTDAWIITGGTNSGVMKEVGDAIDKYRYKNTKKRSEIPCIAISSWHYTTDVEDLRQIPPDPHSIEAVTSTILDLTIENTVSRVKSYNNRKPDHEIEEGCDIDPNHTHFILLDDGYPPKGKNEGEDWRKFYPKEQANCRADLILNMRAEIEQEAAMMPGEAIKIPIIQVLTEGGASSILTICNALEKNTPVIVIKDSGRAADTIAALHKLLYGVETDRFLKIYEDSEKNQEIQQKFNRTLELMDNQIVNNTNRTVFGNLMKSKKGYFLITIFQFRLGEVENKLDDAILQALFNGIT